MRNMTKLDKIWQNMAYMHDLKKNIKRTQNMTDEIYDQICKFTEYMINYDKKWQNKTKYGKIRQNMTNTHSLKKNFKKRQNTTDEIYDKIWQNIRKLFNIR